MIVALTGHRRLEKGFDREKLKNALAALAEEGADTFLCGMAMGFDLLCCEILLSLKEKYPLKVEACVPCADQSERFPPAAKAAYEDLLSRCDAVTVLHETYCDGCMFERNRYMADKCDLLFAYLHSPKGGTAYTVRYAEKKGKQVAFFGGGEER